MLLQLPTRRRPKLSTTAQAFLPARVSVEGHCQVICHILAICLLAAANGNVGWGQSPRWDDAEHRRIAPESHTRMPRDSGTQTRMASLPPSPAPFTAGLALAPRDGATGVMPAGPTGVVPTGLDPRDRCNRCLFPAETAPATRWDFPGVAGRPHRETLPGGCYCDSPRGITRHPDASIHWPRPFSAGLNNRYPQAAAAIGRWGEDIIQRPFDRLADYPGVFPYQRSDNGYCGGWRGEGRDPYGCVGESRAAAGIYGSGAGVVGLGVRSPGQPLPRN